MDEIKRNVKGALYLISAIFAIAIGGYWSIVAQGYLALIGLAIVAVGMTNVLDSFMYRPEEETEVEEEVS